MLGLLFHVQVGSIFHMWRKLTSREWRFLVLLLLIYYVTKKELTLLYDAQTGTIARCRYFYFVAWPSPPCDTDVDHYQSWTSLCL